MKTRITTKTQQNMNKSCFSDEIILTVTKKNPKNAQQNTKTKTHIKKPPTKSQSTKHTQKITQNKEENGSQKISQEPVSASDAPLCISHCDGLVYLSEILF